jgi:hypothetical protein
MRSQLLKCDLRDQFFIIIKQKKKEYNFNLINPIVKYK